MSTTGQDPAPPQSLLSTILESRQLLNPFRWILCAVYFLPHTIINQLLSGHLPIPGPRLHEAWFGRFWAWMGPNVKEMATPAVVPLLKDAKGTVLEVGAGNGQWMNCYPDKVTKVVAVEPNPMSVMQMRKAIVENGKEEVYVVVPNGVEGLAGVDGLKKGSVDTIVTVLSLCSVPMPKETIRELYGYLKPGGKWLLFEHVQAPRPNDITGWWQRQVDPIWAFCFGGCRITRPTEAYLREAGPWKEVAIKHLSKDDRFAVLPHITGHLTK